MPHITKEEVDGFRANPGLVDTLTILIEQGPVGPDTLLHSDLTRKLINLGYAHHIVVKLDDGYYAASTRGRDMYKHVYGTCLGGEADTMREAYANRMSAVTLKDARRHD